MRVVLDTDVLVAAFRSRSGASFAWVAAILGGEATMLVSVPLAFEYEAVLKRAAHLRAVGGTAGDVDRFLDGLFDRCQWVAINFLWRPTLADPDDDMVLEAAVNGPADCLLTFNGRDFAAANRFKLQIASPGQAWRSWRGDSP